MATETRAEEGAGEEVEVEEDVGVGGWDLPRVTEAVWVSAVCSDDGSRTRAAALRAWDRQRGVGRSEGECCCCCCCCCARDGMENPEAEAGSLAKSILRDVKDDAAGDERVLACWCCCDCD